jgi:hypothetical protein
MPAAKKSAVTEAVPEAATVRQPTRHVEAPPRGEFSADGRTLEPDTSSSGRPATGVSASTFRGNVMDQLKQGAAANGYDLPEGESPDLPEPDSPEPEQRPNVTRVADVQFDPRAPISVYTDKRTKPEPPKVATRTRIAVGEIDEAIVSEERMYRIKPKSTCQRWIGPYRYHFTKDVVCEVPESVRDSLLREELIVPYYH